MRKDAKKAIKTAFVSLIETRGIDALSISDIARTAEINRGTFYLHYLDKADLLSQLKSEFIAGLLLFFDDLFPLSVTKVSSESLTQSYVPLLEYIHREHAFIQALLGSGGDSAFYNELKDAFRGKVLYYFTSLSDESLLENIPHLPKDYAEEILLSSTISVILFWIKKGLVEPPEKITEILVKTSFLGPCIYHT